MSTEPGARRRLTARFGCRQGWPRDGHLIPTGTGSGSVLGAGPGSTTSLGDSRHSTMAAGFMAMVSGAGLRGRTMPVLFMPPRWLPGLGDRALGSDLDSGWAAVL